jgi:acyl-CoA dehydrogenase
MDFSFNDEQRMIQETATKIGEQYGLDYWREHDRAKKIPHGVLERSL